MSKSIKKKLMMIVNIASCDELNHRQRTKIKYLAQDSIVALTDDPVKDDTPSKQQALMLRLKHVYEELDDVITDRENFMKGVVGGEKYKMSIWCGLYSEYLELIGRIKENYSMYMVHKKHVPPFLELKKWQDEQEEEA